MLHYTVFSGGRGDWPSYPPPIPAQQSQQNLPPRSNYTSLKRSASNISSSPAPSSDRKTELPKEPQVTVPAEKENVWHKKSAMRVSHCLDLPTVVARFLARILEMPVYNSNLKFSSCQELVPNLLWILIPLEAKIRSSSQKYLPVQKEDCHKAPCSRYKLDGSRLRPCSAAYPAGTMRNFSKLIIQYLASAG